LRIAVAGLGSMGSRRVRDAVALGHEVVGFDVRADRRRSATDRFGIAAAESFDELADSAVEALVISTPPDQHVSYYEWARARSVPFFSEANILTPRPEWFEGAIGFPSATWRFYPPLQALHQELETAGTPLTVHHQYGSFLPLWHPYESYDDFYAGRRRETCAAREMVPFELEWLTWLFGPVAAVTGWHGRLREWRTDIDDAYSLQLEFERGASGTLLVELHQLQPCWRARVSCVDAAFELDGRTHQLVRHRADGESSVVAAPLDDFESVYHAEIAAFLDAVTGTAEYPKTWAEDRRLSDVLVAAEESARRQARVSVAEVADTYDGFLRDDEALARREG
jgi:predicted dehydrogenase